MTTPGPGTYAPKGQSKQEIPKWSMGKSIKSENFKSTMHPGPGTYNLNEKFKGPKFRFGGKHSASAPSLVPGPGQYTPDYKLRQLSTSFNISLKGRPHSASIRHAPPGPGTYEVKVVKSKCGGMFGKDTRHPLSLLLNVPGPGAYDKQALCMSARTSPKYRHDQILTYYA
jgi:hypothetical protein